MRIDVALPSAPWVYVLAKSDVLLEAAKRDVNARGGVWKSIDAASLAGSEASLFGGLASALSFPDYFGRNWDALEECLGDVYFWLRSDVVVVNIANCDDMLQASFLPLLTAVLCRAGEWASATHDEDGASLDRPSVAMHFVFSLAAGNVTEMAARMRSSGRRQWHRDGRAYIM